MAGTPGEPQSQRGSLILYDSGEVDTEHKARWSRKARGKFGQNWQPTSTSGRNFTFWFSNTPKCKPDGFLAGRQSFAPLQKIGSAETLQERWPDWIFDFSYRNVKTFRYVMNEWHSLQVVFCLPQDLVMSARFFWGLQARLESLSVQIKTKIVLPTLAVEMG